MVTRVTFFLGAVQIGVGIVFNTRGYGGLMCGEGKGCRQNKPSAEIFCGG